VYGVAEEARTRGFAAPAFAGCAFVEEQGLSYRVVQELSRQSGLMSAPLMEQIASTLSLGIGEVLDLVPDGLRRVPVCLPLGQDALEIEPLGRLVELTAMLLNS
jgi:hypothetical protein